MKQILLIIGSTAFAAIILYRVIKSIVENVKRRRIVQKNLDAQFSGTPVSEKRGVLSSFFLSYYGKRADAIGELGERKVSSYLANLPCEDYYVFNDLLIRDGKYTTQIDHIVISHCGVFVLETKNVHGKVYGSGNTEFWKQYLPSAGYKRYGFTQKHQLRNPIWQNEGHIKTLRRLVFGNDLPIYNIVVFPNEADLYVTADEDVLHMWEVVPCIKQHKEVVISIDQMRFMRRRLLEVISTKEIDRTEHLENVYRNKERRDAAVANGLCPRCGGTLILRSGKFGRFYGCSNYPKCQYTLNK